MRNLAELNINKGGEPVTRPAPSDELIAEFEKEFGVTMPDGLRALLKFSNGGHPEASSVGGKDGDHGVNHFFHLTPDRQSVESLWSEMAHWQPILGEDYLVFANNGGGDVYVIDLAEEPPDVGLAFHDEDLIITVAPDFETFIDELEINPDL